MELADTMSVRAVSSTSLSTLICTAIFLTWACHLGRPRIDQLDMPVCRLPDVNATIDEFESECKFYKLSHLVDELDKVHDLSVIYKFCVSLSYCDDEVKFGTVVLCGTLPLWSAVLTQ